MLIISYIYKSRLENINNWFVLNQSKHLPIQTNSKCIKISQTKQTDKTKDRHQEVEVVLCALCFSAPTVTFTGWKKSFQHLALWCGGGDAVTESCLTLAILWAPRDTFTSQGQAVCLNICHLTWKETDFPNKDILYSTGNYIQHFLIIYKEKEPEKEYIWIMGLDTRN